MKAIIPTTIVTTREVKDNGFYKWFDEKDPERFIEIPGYVYGFCVEVKKDNGELGYTSCTFVHNSDYNEIRNPWMCENWNELGIASDCLRAGYEPTGRIVFRGWFESEYDWQEREECYIDKTEEVKELLLKYVSEA